MNMNRKWLKRICRYHRKCRIGNMCDRMTLPVRRSRPSRRMDAEIKNVVVGKVLSMAQTRKPDHMWVCMVDVGRGRVSMQIVTGAP